jgi:hypothetical protein
MPYSRLSRVEEKSARHRIAIGIIGSITILILLGVFGIKFLIAFSVLVDKLHGGSATQQPAQVSVLVPPVLDQLPEATNSATISISGTATPKDQVIVYLNTTEYKRVSPDSTGAFQLADIPVDVGTVTVSAKLTDGKKNMSDPSNTITTVVDRTPPKLTVSSPTDTTTVNDGTHKVEVTGITDPDMNITITGRIVVVRSDGTFDYSMPLNDGANKLEIVATDAAGNSTTVERNVTYQP